MSRLCRRPGTPRPKWPVWREFPYVQSTALQKKPHSFMSMTLRSERSGGSADPASSAFKASEGRMNRKRGDRCPSLPNARLPKELIQILVSPDSLGVARGRESRIRYNSMDVIAGLAY